MVNSTTTSINLLNNPFLFDNKKIRTAVDDHGEVWFCAKDVFEALGIVWKGTKGSLMNCPEKWLMVWYLQTTTGQKESIFISEPAVYQTVFRSNKPEALQFAEWVCEEVLPAIRKQGYFGSIAPGNQVQLTTVMLKLLDKVSSKDAFIHQVAINRLRNICNTFGEPMPDVDLIGKDRKQLPLQGV